MDTEVESGCRLLLLLLPPPQLLLLASLRSKLALRRDEDDTDDAQQQIRGIVNQLKTQGVPVEEIFSEVSGRGKDNEIVEDLDNELLKRMIKNYDIEFENFMLEKFIAEEAEKTPVDQFVL